MILLALVLCVFTLTTTVEAKKRPPLFVVPIIGFTDVDGIDWFEGLASGAYGKDVRGQWDGCLNGFPTIVGQLINIFEKVLGHIANPLSIIKDPSVFADIFSLGFSMIKEVPKDISDCMSIVGELETGI